MFRSQNVVRFLAAALVVTDSMFFAAVAYADGSCRHDDHSEAYYSDNRTSNNTCRCQTPGGGGGGVASVAGQRYFLTSLVLVDGEICQGTQTCQGSCEMFDGWDDGACFECAGTDQNCDEVQTQYIHYHYPSGCVEEAEEGQQPKCKCVKNGERIDKGIRQYVKAVVTDC